MKKRSEAETGNAKLNIEARPHGPSPRRTMTAPAPDGRSQGGDPAVESFLAPSESRRLDGVAVSPGVAIARAHCLHDIPVGSVIDPTDETGALDELSSFEEALQLTVKELQGLYEKVAVQVGKAEAAIFRAHLAILQDPALLEKIQRQIGEQRQTATVAVHEVAKQYEELFNKVKDDYLRERVADLRDVLRRLQRNVTRTEHQGFAARQPRFTKLAPRATHQFVHLP